MSKLTNFTSALVLTIVITACQSDSSEGARPLTLEPIRTVVSPVQTEAVENSIEVSSTMVRVNYRGKVVEFDSQYLVPHGDPLLMDVLSIMINRNWNDQVVKLRSEGKTQEEIDQIIDIEQIKKQEAAEYDMHMRKLVRYNMVVIKDPVGGEGEDSLFNEDDILVQGIINKVNPNYNCFSLPAQLYLEDFPLIEDNTWVDGKAFLPIMNAIAESVFKDADPSTVYGNLKLGDVVVFKDSKGKGEHGVIYVGRLNGVDMVIGKHGLLHATWGSLENNIKFYSEPGEPPLKLDVFRFDDEIVDKVFPENYDEENIPTPQLYSDYRGTELYMDGRSIRTLNLGINSPEEYLKFLHKRVVIQRLQNEGKTSEEIEKEIANSNAVINARASRDVETINNFFERQNMVIIGQKNIINPEFNSFTHYIRKVYPDLNIVSDLVLLNAEGFYQIMSELADPVVENVTRDEVGKDLKIGDSVVLKMQDGNGNYIPVHVGMVVDFKPNGEPILEGKFDAYYLALGTLQSTEAVVAELLNSSRMGPVLYDVIRPKADDLDRIMWFNDNSDLVVMSYSAEWSEA